MIVTADHGNLEMMRDPVTGQPHTAHTVGPVPLVYVGRAAQLRDGGSLRDIAPTMLALAGPGCAGRDDRPLPGGVALSATNRAGGGPAVRQRAGVRADDGAARAEGGGRAEATGRYAGPDQEAGRRAAQDRERTQRGRQGLARGGRQGFKFAARLARDRRPDRRAGTGPGKTAAAETGAGKQSFPPACGTGRAGALGLRAGQERATQAVARAGSDERPGAGAGLPSLFPARPAATHRRTECGAAGARRTRRQDPGAAAGTAGRAREAAGRRGGAGRAASRAGQAGQYARQQLSRPQCPAESIGARREKHGGPARAPAQADGAIAEADDEAGQARHAPVACQGRRRHSAGSAAIFRWWAPCSLVTAAPCPTAIAARDC